MDNDSPRRNILKIRCSDGRCRKPPYVRGHFVHQIRLPGGVLFPDLCAQQFNQTVVSKLLRRVIQHVLRRAMFFAIEVMVDLKSPDEIILMGHSPCGAAEAMNLHGDDVKAVHVAWQELLQKRFANIPVVVLFERHSACGNHHEGYEQIST